jgi:hypothetical protein
MATSSIPASLDWLVANIGALPECAAPTTVHDGFPVGTGPTAVAIGVRPHEDGDTEDEVVEAQLGAQLEWEEFVIPCIISAWIGGGEEATKMARDEAFRVFNAIVTLIRTLPGRKLGGALHSAYSMVTGVQVKQTYTPTQAGEGRTCSIAFNVRAKNKF